MMLSPLNQRYRLDDLEESLSEEAITKWRLFVEIRWLRLLESLGICEVSGLDELWAGFNDKSLARIAELERECKHDMKALERFIAENVKTPFVHFGLTSEDVCNCAFAKAFSQGFSDVVGRIDKLQDILGGMVRKHARTPMLAMTHGQPASPTTFGKEMMNFRMRFEEMVRKMRLLEVHGKVSGATGNMNALKLAYPGVKWPTVLADFVESLGLRNTKLTTQIEPRDWLVEHLDALAHANAVASGLCRDMWGYISRGVVIQRKDGVGSSTMPHKVNPISFENAEGNFGLANSILRFMSEKFSSSRMQRDLSDSTVMRNVGVALGHSALGFDSLIRGLKSVDADVDSMDVELESHWEVLTEAIQTMLRKSGDAHAYDTILAESQGRTMDKEEYLRLVESLGLPDDDAETLLSLTPQTYVGLAYELCKR